MKRGDPRVLAAQVLSRVIWQGAGLDRALEQACARGQLHPADRALLQEFCYGVTRWALPLQALAGRLLNKGLKERDRDVLALLMLGLYQLLYMRIRPHAAVHETVAGATGLGKPWAKSLLNACLRRFLREQNAWHQTLDGDPALTAAHPAWLLARLQRDWSREWPSVVAADNARPPMILRVNLRALDRETYLDHLARAGMAAQALPGLDAGLRLERPCPVSALPGFDRGWVSVQDGGAQWAAPLLDARPGQRVLDACAAPGGKTAHILERTGELAALVAVERDPERLAMIHATLERLGLEARVFQGDAADPAAWWDGVPFQRILVDAPCSATGVIRRHPDIKLHRRPEDVEALCHTQDKILHALWPLLAPGGKLLYATCSVLRRENEDRVRAFLSLHDDAHTVSLAEAVEATLPEVAARARQTSTSPGIQILPGEGGMDGFYYACLQKD